MKRNGQNMDEIRPSRSSDSESDENEDEHESDRELQVAFEQGLLSNDRLNRVIEDRKRPQIYDHDALKSKANELKLQLPWIETLEMSVKATEADVPKDAIDDDFAREIIFLKQAQNAVQLALPRLHRLGVAVFRPNDYYAEMAKSDDHMTKVRRKLIETSEGKQRQEAIRRLRDEKKFASKVQKEVLDSRQGEKRKLLEAVKKHRKGMKAQLDQMLDNARQNHQQDDDDGDRQRRTFPSKSAHQQSSKSRTSRDQKFGFGGQKKRSKQNDATSFGAIVSPGNMKKGKTSGGKMNKRKGGKKRRNR